MRDIQLRPINVIMAQVDAETEQSYENVRRNAEERKRQIELNFQAAALLDGAGIDLEIPEWTQLYVLPIDLGDKPTLKKDWRARDAFVKTLNNIRRALDCPLKSHSKHAASDGKHVEIILTTETFPGVRICYRQRLPKGGKCKIKTTTYKSRELVCDL